MKVLHLITGLQPGGAEHMLYRLVGGMDRTRFQSVVVSVTEGGTVAGLIEAAGSPVISLNLRRGIPDPRALIRLFAVLRKEKPVVVQTWLYHADLLGLIARITPAALLWNIRCSNMDMRDYSRMSRVVISAGARASRFPDAVIVNSMAGLRWHESLGYRPPRWVYIPNGVDTETFKPDASVRRQVREELGVGAEVPLVGMIARFDPMKDHPTFFAAAKIVAGARPDVRFVLAGDGITAENRVISTELFRLGIGDRTHLLGYRSDAARIMAGLDVLVLSSAYGEGFPNVVAEAMACGVPPVATDVGDSREIIGDLGVVVPPQSPDKLAAGILAMLEDRKQAPKLRDSIARRFSMPAIVEAYESLYDQYRSG